MVHRLHDHPAVGGALEEAEAEERVALQVVRPAVLGNDRAVDVLPLLVLHVEQGYIRARLRRHPLQGYAVDRKEVGAQCRVPGHHAAHGLEHEVGVECDPDLDGAADVVRIALGVELPEEPQCLLVLRQRVAEFVLVHLHLAHVGVSGLVGDQLGQGVVELCDQLGDRGAAQQGHHWRGDAELGADPGSQFHRQE